MIRIANYLSDLFVIIDANPRLENRRNIIGEILGDVDPEFLGCVLIQYRRRSIEFILGQFAYHSVGFLQQKSH